MLRLDEPVWEAGIVLFAGIKYFSCQFSIGQMIGVPVLEF